jgi:hypothetical protein
VRPMNAGLRFLTVSGICGLRTPPGANRMSVVSNLSNPVARKHLINAYREPGKTYA